MYFGLIVKGENYELLVFSQIVSFLCGAIKMHVIEPYVWVGGMWRTLKADDYIRGARFGCSRVFLHFST